MKEFNQACGGSFAKGSISCQFNGTVFHLRHILSLRFSLSVALTCELDDRLFPRNLVFRGHPCSLLITSSEYVALDCSALAPFLYSA